jgi:hypothetical protein
MTQAPPDAPEAAAAAAAAAPARKQSPLARAIPWAIALACFVYLYFRIDAAAARQGSSFVPYLAGVFAGVPWTKWLMLMVPYSFLFMLIDSAVVWRVINWFNAKVAYLDIVPVRASTYIISILNEQVGKGAMAVYLNRRDGVPGWQVGSSMLFIMFCELLYLSLWATIGVSLGWNGLPAVFHAIPWVAVGVVVLFAFVVLYFRGAILPNHAMRDREIFHAFRQAHVGHYLGVIAIRSPALLTAVVVYTLALRLFGVEVGFVEMLGYLPVIFFGAAVPGPMRSVAITLWVTLFPDNAGEMAAFGLVQHNFFIFFNAAIGLLFLRRANREIWGEGSATRISPASGPGSG